MARLRAHFLTSLSMKTSTAFAAILALALGAGVAKAITPEDERYAAYIQSQNLSLAAYGLSEARADAEVAPSTPDAPQPIVEAPTWKLNPDFVASQDEKLEGCVGPRSRFCKIKPSLLPIYEKVSRETGVPAALLYAVGEYETHNRPNAMADGGKSCGLFGFNTWKRWGFSSLAECHDPEASIRKLAGNYTRFIDTLHKGSTRSWLCRHNAGPDGCAIGDAATYASRVMKYADELYAAKG